MNDFISRTWVLDADYFHRLLPIVQAGHEMKLIPKGSQELKVHEYLVDAELEDSDEAGDKTLVISGNVGFIPVKGVMTRYGDACSMGNEDIMTAIANFNADSNVRAIVLIFDTYGGEVNGITQLGDAIKKSEKVIVGWVINACSGGIWGASQCRELVVEDPMLSKLGSMSAFRAYENVQGKLEKEGITVEIIRADDSADKLAINPVEPMSADARTSIKTELNQIKSRFVAKVLEGRNGKLANDAALFTGKVWNGKEAVKMGLADSIGSLQMAAQRALFLARKEQISTQKQKNGDNNMKILTNEESAAIQLQVTELTEQNAALVVGNTEFNGRISALQTENVAHVATIATHVSRIAELESQVSTLEVQAANAEKFIVPPVDKIQQAFAANVMDLPDGHPDKETAKLIAEIKKEA